MQSSVRPQSGISLRTQNAGVNRKETIYWRTHAGSRAWACAASGLPAHYRRILGAIHAPSAVASIHHAVKPCSESQLLSWLDELDTLGFIQTGRAAAAYYLEAA
jgi:hypothetical protein